MNFRFISLDEVQNYVTAPSLDEMLNYDFWELHEAAFLLSETWPTYLIKSHCEELAINENISRSFIYEPMPPKEHPNPLKWKFSPQEFGREFAITLRAMQESFHTGSLPFAKVLNLGIDTVYGEWKLKGNSNSFEGTWLTYLFPSHEVIKWAIRKGIRIPNDLQNALGINLLDPIVTKSSVRSVNRKIALQILMELYPDERDVFYLNHKLMRGLIEGESQHRASRRKIQDTVKRDKSNKQGNISNDEVKNRNNEPKPIQEICEYIDGKLYYHIPHLKIATERAINIWLQEYFKEFDKVDESKEGFDRFLDSFMKSKTISLYAQDAPLIINDLIYAYAHNRAIYCFPLCIDE